MGNTGEVRDDVEFGFADEPLDDIAGEVSSCPPGTIGDADEGGRKLVEFIDGLEQFFRSFLTTWRKKFKRKSGFVSFEQGEDIHGRINLNAERQSGCSKLGKASGDEFHEGRTHAWEKSSG